MAIDLSEKTVTGLEEMQRAVDAQLSQAQLTIAEMSITGTAMSDKVDIMSDKPKKPVPMKGLAVQPKKTVICSPAKINELKQLQTALHRELKNPYQNSDLRVLDANARGFDSVDNYAKNHNATIDLKNNQILRPNMSQSSK